MRLIRKYKSASRSFDCSSKLIFLNLSPYLPNLLRCAHIHLECHKIIPARDSITPTCSFLSLSDKMAAASKSQLPTSNSTSRFHAVSGVTWGKVISPARVGCPRAYRARDEITWSRDVKLAWCHLPPLHFIYRALFSLVPCRCHCCVCSRISAR